MCGAVWMIMMVCLSILREGRIINDKIKLSISSAGHSKFACFWFKSFIIHALVDVCYISVFCISSNSHLFKNSFHLLLAIRLNLNIKTRQCYIRPQMNIHIMKNVIENSFMYRVSFPVGPSRLSVSQP